MTLEIGTRLGHYRIVALLGQGGMSDVYRAEDEHLGREVALKAVPPEFARYPDRVKRFEREVRAAAQLTHTNIVTVHEFGKSEGQLFYTMALMTGGDLKARIRDNPEGMPVAEARAVAATMAKALDYAHQRGFVHRDVKPENILFGEDGTPRLTDFGIARVMAEETRMTETGRGIGSPRYMSPEQARGQAVDGRSDLYSLGVVFYEMLTGQVPFDAADTFAVGLRHINDPVPRLPQKVAAWQPVLDRALAKSPEDRYASAGELAEVLASDAPPRAPGTETLPAQPEATGEIPAQPDATGTMPAQPPSTEPTPAQQDASPTSEPAKPGPAEAPEAKLRRGPLIAVAGGVLVVALAGIGYLSLQDGNGSEPTPSNGAEGEETVQAEAESADAAATPESQVDPESPEPGSPEGSADQAGVKKEPAAKPAAPKPAQAAAKRSARVSRPAPKPDPRDPKPVLGGSALLVVETTPPGTEVLVDGRPVGKTPLERSDIRAGVWDVSLAASALRAACVFRIENSRMGWLRAWSAC